MFRYSLRGLEAKVRILSCPSFLYKIQNSIEQIQWRFLRLVCGSPPLFASVYGGAVMKCPWHSIPELDLKMSQHKSVNYISLFQQLANYHHYRVTRLIAGQGDAEGESGQKNYTQFYGAVDVSFITLY